MKWMLATLALASLNALSAEANLEIVSDQQRLTLSQSQLLARRDVRTVSVGDSAYQQTHTRFKAIPFANLFRGVTIPDTAVVQFQATDGFSASLEKTRLFSADPNGSRAFLAIEDPKHPWPHLPGKADVRRTVLPCVDESAGLRHQLGGMAISDCLVHHSGGCPQCIPEDLPGCRCDASGSERVQVVPAELLPVPQAQWQWGGRARP